ncbi:2OG-Fe(II) oxygenase [Pantanalinema rosaneae CENA516]|uniref:2OG-Fe(II) oxygenase n=1 Tax=Pantanalinema rosaneae TaxID=1620701 RepID=UPI003D6E07EB
MTSTVVKSNSSAENLMFRFDSDALQALALQYREEYANNTPFPHIMLDDFFPEFVLDNILNEFPKPDDIEWQRFKNSAEKKLASRHEQQMGDATRLLLYQLNSATFISFLETLTGIEGLVPDPHFAGGGLHQIEPGGFLKMHVDFNKHEKINLDRRLNLLIYLNKDWEEEYGGCLELWDQNMTRCEKKILPIFNRFVVFSTTDFSYHGHPDPLTCPEGRTRKSLALYYYTNGRPASEVKENAHSTIFLARPNDDISQADLLPKKSFKDVVKQFIPPILLELGKGLKKQ